MIQKTVEQLKPDPEILKRIAEELDLSLQQLLKAAGYNEVMSWFSHDEFKNKSTKDLKNTIEECRLFKYDILDWDANKGKKALKIMQNLNEIKLGLRLIKEDSKTDYTIDKSPNDIEKEIDELKEIATKYDYSKLPKDIQEDNMKYFDEINEFKEEVQNNPEKFYEELTNFLK